MTKKLLKNSDYNPGQNYSNTKSAHECTYKGLNFVGPIDLAGGFEISSDSIIQVNYFYKNKSLEVLERDFALKYPGPYKAFIEEQNRRLLDFIVTYTKNHEENT